MASFETKMTPGYDAGVVDAAEGKPLPEFWWLDGRHCFGRTPQFAMERASDLLVEAQFGVPTRPRALALEMANAWLRYAEVALGGRR